MNLKNSYALKANLHNVSNRKSLFDTHANANSNSKRLGEAVKSQLCGIVVAPMLKSHHYDIEQSRLLILIESISSNWRGKSPFKLYLVAEASYIDNCDAWIGQFGNINICTIDARQLSLNCGISPDLFDQWRRRHLLNMLACEWVDEEAALILSPEVLSVRPFDNRTFIAESRLVSEWEPLDGQEWWVSTAKLLKIKLAPDGYGLSVWPNLVSIAVMREVLTWTLEQFGDLTTFLWSAGRIVPSANVVWTDMSIYTVVGANCGILQKYHVPAMESFNLQQSRLRSHKSIWQSEGSQEMLLMFDPQNSDAAFIHIGLNTGISPDRIRELLVA